MPQARRRLTQQVGGAPARIGLQVQFSKAADASNRAVMSDQPTRTPLPSAREAEQATQAVLRDVEQLPRGAHVDGLFRGARLVGRFANVCARIPEARRREFFRSPSRTPTLKAQRLSFGPAREAVDAFRAALDGVTSRHQQALHADLERLRRRAVADVLEIQVLHAPHIAEADGCGR